MFDFDNEDDHFNSPEFQRKMNKFFSRNIVKNLMNINIPTMNNTDILDRAVENSKNTLFAYIDIGTICPFCNSTIEPLIFQLMTHSLIYYVYNHIARYPYIEINDKKNNLQLTKKIAKFSDVVVIPGFSNLDYEDTMLFGLNRCEQCGKIIYSGACDQTESKINIMKNFLSMYAEPISQYHSPFNGIFAIN